MNNFLEPFLKIFEIINTNKALILSSLAIAYFFYVLSSGIAQWIKKLWIQYWLTVIQNRLGREQDGLDFLCPINSLPTIKIEKPELKDTELHQYVNQKYGLQQPDVVAEASKLKTNDPHYFVDANWIHGNFDRFQIPVVRGSFAQLCAIRKSSWDTCGMLSANTLVTTQERKLSDDSTTSNHFLPTLLVQLRSKESHVYPNCHGTFGGGYFPPSHRRGDRNLIGNALREQAEESSIYGEITRDKLPPMFLLRESTNKNIQLAFIGVPVSFSAAREAERDIKANAEENEGIIKLLSWNDLKTSIYDKSFYSGWTPSGKAAVLVWLVLGAPARLRLEAPLINSWPFTIIGKVATVVLKSHCFFQALRLLIIATRYWPAEARRQPQ